MKIKKKKKILITGVAGFIGFSLAKKIIQLKKYDVIGIDNLNSYYIKKLKLKRLSLLKKQKLKFYKIDLTEKNKLNNLFKKYNFDIVFNFAAQAGVRYSFENPKSYTDSNIIGFINLIEVAKNFKIDKFIFASSSSIYGDQRPFPKTENSDVNPINLYSLSKLSNEQFAKSICKKMNTKVIGLRFFTIYGPWGRPDMMILKYLISAYKKLSFPLFNNGNHFRDFTYIDDAINLCIPLLNKKIKKKFEIFNICSSRPLHITKILKEIDKYSPKPLIINKPRDKADVYKTYGDNKKIRIFLGKKIELTSYKYGVRNTCDWFFKNKKIFIK
tara:strand:- start:164 stop:1147 length:984 start_codon:yes stop_codon:yes gene_type:complete